MARARAALVKTSTAEVLRFAFSPKQFGAQIGANYNKASSLGGTGQRLHFGYTSNFTFSIEMYMDKHALEVETEDEFLASAMMTDVQKFLLSCVFPVGRQNDPIRRSPPKLLFLWPNIVEMPVRVITQNFQFEKFENDLSPWIYRVPISLESDLSTVRVTSDVARIRGFMLAGYVG